MLSDERIAKLSSEGRRVEAARARDEDLGPPLLAPGPSTLLISSS